MKTTNDIVAYIYSQLPTSTIFLSKARLQKIIYLADWRHCLLHGEQISDIEWFFNYYGPYVDDITTNLRNDSENRFEFIRINSQHSNVTEMIKYIGNTNESSLNMKDTENETIKFIVEKAIKLRWELFIEAVYSTYPLKVSEKHTYLNLESLAVDYRKKYK